MALSGELNLFMESVAVVPDAVLLPCWLGSHYHPCLFQQETRETMDAMATLGTYSTTEQIVTDHFKF
ncbi:hypothetical protein PAMP_011622 [Pampus punctatissimus]